MANFKYPVTNLISYLNRLPDPNSNPEYDGVHINGGPIIAIKREKDNQGEYHWVLDFADTFEQTTEWFKEHEI